ncbi:uncharacterized protein SCHCODRAFT_02673798 [Schizophyllum commune H4-8]|uniref:uncharacterized protein n=1 Tax=Schizophyllum commune (strain H4-8 / FGSC 9210) TaxID=578458 RepID=UPI00215F6626|nr:uncharacterized protein SCHCODRAFT_02673798 [Schizophyllum commune H4-8]KAI5885189.1 hypothetical protein SCHCODRAFT_02673798 [Schizophyllum commune H4-8]
MGRVAGALEAARLVAPMTPCAIEDVMWPAHEAQKGARHSPVEAVLIEAPTRASLRASADATPVAVPLPPSIAPAPHGDRAGPQLVRAAMAGYRLPASSPLDTLVRKTSQRRPTNEPARAHAPPPRPAPPPRSPLIRSRFDQAVEWGEQYVRMWGSRVSAEVQEIIAHMREHPDRYETATIPLLQSTNEHALFWEKIAAVRAHPEQLSTTTDGSPYAVSEYEKWLYYHGNRNTLVYRSDLHSNPFPSPSPGARPPQRRLDHFSRRMHPALHGAWNAPARVHNQVCDALRARGITFYDACLYRVREGDEDEDVWPAPEGRPIVWVLVPPGAVTAEVAHEVSEEIFALLEKQGIARGDLEAEWAEGHVRIWGPGENYVELQKNFSF